MDERRLFRYPPDYRAAPIETALDWSAWGGFLGAAEMCNNNGACRKAEPGVMCPSYRATRDEQHVTRGRANTLRLALSGQLGPDALTSAAMAATLDLCVACKACRRECPTGVDMARMKIEVMHQMRRRGPLPLRDRVIAYLPRYAPQASRARWLMHLRDRVPGAAALSERALGFSARRSLPRWHPRPYRPAPNGQPLAGDGRDVVLFADTFTTWFEPDNARAAVAVLEAAGYRVHAPQPPARRPLCCGRTFLAAGLVEQARSEARATLAALSPFVEAAVPVLGLEPSCLLTMRDEFTALLPGQATAALAEHALLLEEFLWREQAAGRLSLALQRGRQAPGAGAWSLPSEGVRRHGGADRLPRHGSRAAGRDHRVRAVAGWRARSVTRPSTMRFRYAWRSWRCCPRCAPPTPDTLIVANGTSCRHQIHDGAGREAVHAARVLADALADRLPAGSHGASANGVGRDGVGRSPNQAHSS